jgi:RES domain-containing protein
VTQVAFRIADWRSPLRVNPNRTPGRFHRAGQLAQYTCLHPLGPWAEFLRHEEPSAPLAASFRHRVWALRLELDGALVLDFDDAGDWGLEPFELVDDDQGACRAFADRARAAGHTTLVVPSAALPGTKNVVVLEPRVASPWDVAPFDPVDVPTALVAEDATIPEELLPLVRHQGQPHAAFEAWADERQYDFEDPVWNDWELPGAR